MITDLSITTDYIRGDGDPEPYLRDIAEAGFSHILWCHEWCTDYLYSQSEIHSIKNLLAEYGLTMLDLHASSGNRNNWSSEKESDRQAGVLLVQNRIAMAAELACEVIIMHVPEEINNSLRRSLDELEPYSKKRNVKIALENGNFSVITQLIGEYNPDFLGLCYDAGHGNLANADGPSNLNKLRDRLLSIHLHDNDGVNDLHRLLFSGTVDWDGLAKQIASSSYEKCISMEVAIYNTGIREELIFLQNAFQTGRTFSRMVSAAATGASVLLSG